LSSCWTIDR